MKKPKNYHISCTGMSTTCMNGRLPLDGFQWRKDKITFILDYDEDSDEGYILEVDVKYPKKLQELQSDMPFLP